MIAELLANLIVVAVVMVRISIRTPAVVSELFAALVFEICVKAIICG